MARNAGAVIWVVASVLATGVTGCTSVNRPLNAASIAIERRVHNRTRAATGVEAVPVSARNVAGIRADKPDESPTAAVADVRPDGCFVGLALSGGGSRSANFSAGCMFQLQRVGVLQHVDYVSTVSGGSLTGAYYCLYGDGPGGWNPARVQRKLTTSFATDVIRRSLTPWNLPALWFTDWDRSDILADSFTSHLFSRKGRTLTFGDLRPDRPRLLINATDLQSGRRFVFSNESFDELNSNLAKYPISHAVAASAAVPVLMHQVTLRDFSTTFRQYRHLIDGGVVDNLGVQTLVEAYTAQVKSAADAGRPDPYPRGAVLIVLDARTEFDAKLSNRGDISFISSLTMGAGLTSTALLNRVSTATMADLIVRNAADETTAGELRRTIKALEDSGSVTVTARDGKPVRVLHLALSRVEGLSSLPSRSFREQVNSIATYFNSDPTEAYNLYQAAELLVRERFEPQLVALREELEGKGRPDTRPHVPERAPAR
jgi:predicted acylesterase/phospholipase RssA